MSGHSKWATIKRKKDVTDSKRGKIFTQHAKLIALSAQQGGGDISMNATLRAAVDRAKLDNVPNTNIDRAIKKGTGELKEGEAISELTYEGYGPGGVAFYVQVVTDNKNRAVSNVRSLFTKHGGNLGGPGSVAWMFGKKGVIEVGTAGTAMEGKSRDEVELALIEAGAEDIEFGAGGDGASGKAGGAELSALVYTKFEDLTTVKKALEAAGFNVFRAESEFIPKNTVAITDSEVAGKVLRLAEALEEDEDVNSVSMNAEMAEEVAG